MSMRPQITFYGAAGEVTGSCTLIETEQSRLLVDFGMFQGRDNRQRNEIIPDISPQTLNAIILTHAHIDHCGRLPLLPRLGYEGPIYMTSATKALLPRVLFGSAHVQRLRTKEFNFDNPNSPPKEPMFVDSDVSKTLELAKPLEFKCTSKITSEVSLILHDTAHILGAASVTLKIRKKDNSTFTLVFSGDVGNQTIPPLPPPDPPANADCLILESTYGARLKSKDSNPLESLRSIFKVAAESGGRVMIPTFALGRCQQILYRIGELSRRKELFGLPVYLDFRTAKFASSVYNDFPHLLSKESQDLLDKGIDPLCFDELFIIEKSRDAKKIRNARGEGIVIAGSGFCEGGPIVEHLKQNITDKNAHLILAGHQIENTPSANLAEGSSSILLDGMHYEVNAQVHKVDGFSGHADQSELINWVESMEESPKEIILNHGDPEAIETLKNILETKYKKLVHKAQIDTFLPRTHSSF